MKILILRFSSIGDIVLTTPVIRTLKTQLSEVELHFATKKEYLPVLEENPYLDQIHLLEGGLSAFISQLKKEKFDFIIDLHHNLRTLAIKKQLGVKSFSFNKLNLQKWLYTNLKINKMPNTHLVDRYMDTVAPLGVKMDNLGLDYFIADKDEVELNWLPESYQKGFVAFAIGGKFATKKLPKDRIIELCDRINKPIVLLGGKEDAETGETVELFFQRDEKKNEFAEGLEALGKKAIVFNACGKFNLNQSASLIRQSRWVFTHDTGLMHIAAAFKKDIFCIWGNTVPEFGMYPYRTKFTIFENKKLDCRPCSKLGFDKCPKGHFKCMNEVSFDFYLPD
ncbi:glycosyltransferase family 9 protein [Marinoscillum sp.]|uniref:glycosyltransferase family 9 protein n=1 Tax=Marinoscillum sp. TaxID=2024838 RepID=UPI003BACB15F